VFRVQTPYVLSMSRESPVESASGTSTPIYPRLSFVTINNPDDINHARNAEPFDDMLLIISTIKMTLKVWETQPLALGERRKSLVPSLASSYIRVLLLRNRRALKAHRMTVLRLRKKGQTFLFGPNERASATSSF
jgi:hypothetical protein